MMQGLARAPGPYQPTNYWGFYEKRFLPELKRLGLRGFRRREHSVLESFVAVDLPVRASLSVGGRLASTTHRGVGGVVESHAVRAQKIPFGPSSTLLALPLQ